MSPERYNAAWGLVDRLASAPQPRPFPVSRGIPETLPVAKNAIYVAVDEGGAVRYVGKSERSASVRLREHARDPDRAAAWGSIWVIPLRDDLTRRQVEIAEGRIGRYLRPTDNRRLPRC
jgi:hypothetical protein